jgi:mRNA-degrading endonuclease RelE of RelBE toxin-antitoxin system
MRPYAVYINEAALKAAPRSGLQREQVMNFIRSLADNPNAPDDFSEKDDAARTIQVKIIGRYAVTFWTDHAVSEIKVTHIKSADK